MFILNILYVYIKRCLYWTSFMAILKVTSIVYIKRKIIVHILAKTPYTELIQACWVTIFILTLEDFSDPKFLVLFPSYSLAVLFSIRNTCLNFTIHVSQDSRKNLKLHMSLYEVEVCIFLLINYFVKYL